MKNKLLSLILVICVLCSVISCNVVVFGNPDVSYIGDWMIQNHAQDGETYVTDEQNGNVKVTTSGIDMLELIRFPDESKGSDIVTIRFGVLFEDTSIRRTLAVRGTDMATHNNTAEITALRFGDNGRCRVGDETGDTFEYDVNKWYDFTVNVFLRTGHIVANVVCDGADNTYDGKLSTTMYDLWRVYFIAWSGTREVQTNYHIKNFDIIHTPYMDSYPENGGRLPVSKGHVRITFPTKIVSVSSVLINGTKVSEKDIRISNNDVLISCNFDIDTDYVLKYHGVMNDYGDIYSGELCFRTSGDTYMSDIEYLSNGKVTDILQDGVMGARFTLNSQIGKTINVYAAIYNARTNELEDVASAEYKLEPGETRQEISLNTAIKRNDVKMKLFVWDDAFSPIEKVNFPSSLYRPSGKEILDDIHQKTGIGSHPRLFVNQTSLAELKARINNEIEFAESFAQIKSEADALLNKEPLIYEKRDGLRLHPAHNMRPRIQSLGLTYAVTGEEKYAERLWLELETACDFPDWNPYHFLDTGVLLVTFAEGYDWAYDYISKDEQKVNKIVKAVETLGFEPLLDDYLNRPRERTYNWAQAKKADNWNVVCNAGGILAAIAFADESPEYAEEILGYALPLLEKSLIYFAPDGAWFEGLSYWSYMMGYLSDILSALNTSTGEDYGLSKVEGLNKTGYFPFNMSGPGGIFNFSNAGESSGSFSGDSSCFLLANIFDDKNLESLQYNAMKNNNSKFTYKGLLWYKGDFNVNETKLPLDSYYRDTEVCSMRGDNVFVGFRAGSNSVAHSHLDVGSFVLDMDGVRFACDLGREDYNISTTSVRELYRERAEGHNTIVINPDMNPDQIESSFARIDRFVSNENEAFALCDMTEAYSDDVISAIREIRLENGRRTVRLRDEIKCKKESEIWWFMHTQAEIAISEDCKTAYLTRSGKTIKAQLNGDGAFSVMDAVPLQTSPQNANQNKNIGYRKLVINYDNASNIDIDVSFSSMN